MIPIIISLERITGVLRASENRFERYGEPFEPYSQFNVTESQTE